MAFWTEAKNLLPFRKRRLPLRVIALVLALALHLTVLWLFGILAGDQAPVPATARPELAMTPGPAPRLPVSETVIAEPVLHHAPDLAIPKPTTRERLDPRLALPPSRDDRQSPIPGPGDSLLRSALRKGFEHDLRVPAAAGPASTEAAGAEPNETTTQPAAPAVEQAAPGSETGEDEGDPWGGLPGGGVYPGETALDVAVWKERAELALREVKRYPAEALELGIEGQVMLEFEVACDGSARNVRNLTADADPILVQAARDALLAAAGRLAAAGDQPLRTRLSVSVACRAGALEASACMARPDSIPGPVQEAALAQTLKECQAAAGTNGWCRRSFDLKPRYRLSPARVYQLDEASVPSLWLPAIRASASALSPACPVRTVRLPVRFTIEE